MKFLTQRQAKDAGLTRYLSGVPCKAGHLDERYAANAMCTVCERERQRTQYAANPQKHAEWKREYIARNRQQYTENRIRWRSSPGSRAVEMISSAKWSANKKSLPFDIDREWLLPKLEAGVCELTGLPFNLTPLPGGLQNPYTASLDRIVPKLGYVKSNVRVILWALNAAFNSYGESVYADIARVYLAKRGTGLT